MKSLTCAGLLLLGQGLPAVPSQSASIELTGLMEVGRSRFACFKIAGESQGFTLHPGETAAGLTLKEVDAKNGWAVFERGTNQIKVRLVSYCISAPQPAVAALASQARRPRLWTVPGSSVAASFSASPDVTGGAPTANNPTPLWINPFANRPSEASSRNVQPTPPGDTAAPSQTAQPTVAAAPSQASRTTATAPSNPYVSPGANVNDGGSQTAGAPSSSDSSMDPATPRRGPSDARTLEGEQIRAFYGTDAFLAWDIAQGPRS